MSDVNENATDDLRGDIAAAMNPVEEPEVTPEPTETPAEEPVSTSERERDEKGRFKAKTQPEPEKEASVTNEGLIGDGKPAEPTPSEGVDPEPVEVINPPQAWTKEAKEQFANFDPLIQKELLRRETDYSKGIQRNAEDAKWATEHKPVFEQWMPYLNQIGAKPAEAFNALMQAEQVLRHGSPQQKQAAFMKMAQDYGIPLPSQQTNGEVPQTPNPTEEPIYNEVNQLRQQLANIQYQQQQEANRIQQEQETQMQSMINEFSSNPEYPHFEALREQMSQLLQAGTAESLEDAYKQAAWINPEIRSTLIKEEEAKRIKEQAEVATQAKQKAVSVKGTPSGTTPPDAELSLREQLEKAVKGESSRV
jgi:hypothetical protein